LHSTPQNSPFPDMSHNTNFTSLVANHNEVNESHSSQSESELKAGGHKRLGSKGGRKKRRKEMAKAKDVVAFNIMNNFQIGVASVPSKLESSSAQFPANILVEGSPEKLKYRSKEGVGSSATKAFGPVQTNFHSAQPRIEAERKRNAAYDQKFLVKKNFISKYPQPTSKQIVNQVS